MTERKRSTGVAAKVVMPIAATLASAIASYVAKKGPEYLEQTIMPKLRDAKPAGGSVGDVAHDLADRARSAAGGGDAPATEDLERRRRERAEHRAARRQAS